MKRRKKKCKPLPKGVDSKLELDLKNNGMKGCQWKPDPIDYIVRKKYNPDCQFGDVLIEIKGRFRSTAEASKYVWVRKHLPPHMELVFVFASPDCRMPNARRRVDGSYQTHAEWADKNDFVWYHKDHVPTSWGKKVEGKVRRRSDK